MSFVPIPVFKEMWQAHLGTSAEFHPNFGVEKFWMQGENYKKLGACTSTKEHRVGKDAWRSFVGGVIHWHDDIGAEIA